jgi:hypothetical protein
VLAARICAIATVVLVAFAAPAPAGVDRADFVLTLEGPQSALVGGDSTYRIAVTNSGPDKVSAKLRLASGRGAGDTDDGAPLKTLSQTTTAGSCKNDGTGVICRPGSLSVGETVRVTVAAKVLAAMRPKLAVQATVEPETPEAGVDPDKSNNHVELQTPIANPISVKGLPGGCATKPFKLSVATAVVGAERTKVIVDGKVAGKSAKAKLKVPIKPGDLKHGDHALSIVIQGGGGPPLATLKRKFKTC